MFGLIQPRQIPSEFGSAMVVRLGRHGWDSLFRR
jgi:hypothetical protein